MMLSVILLSVLMILLSTLILIRDLIPGNMLNYLLSLNLICETIWNRAGRGLLISVLEKLNRFHLTGLITVVLLMWKWIGLFLRKNHLLRCWGWPSLLNWIKFLSLEVAMFSINLPYSHAWNTVVISGQVHLAATWKC